MVGETGRSRRERRAICNCRSSSCGPSGVAQDAEGAATHACTPRWNPYSRLAAGIRSRRLGNGESSGRVRCGTRRESHSERRAPTRGRPLEPCQRSQCLDGGHSGRQERPIALSATLCQRRPPAADTTAETRGVSHRISAGLYRRLSQESDQTLRLFHGQYRTDLAQSAGRGNRGDRALAGRPAADRERQCANAHRHL